ncbi:MAG: PAS domain-containing protein [Devosia sp.]
MSAAAGTEGQRLAFLEGGGAMGALMRAKDWSQTVLGPPAGWAQALRTVVRLMLNTGHPMYIFWGPTGACLYNDAYARSIGPERHPGSLGQPARAVWDEIWPIIGPQIEQVMAGGPATWHENALVPITRNGQREDVYWTYSYSPIDDDSAPSGVGGVLVVCSETTKQVAAVDSEARFRRLAQSIPNHVWTALDDGNLDWFNDQVYAFSGASRGDLDGQKWAAIVHPEDMGRAAEAWSAALATKQPYATEFRLRRHDGTYRWHIARAVPIADADGTLAWIGTNTDIEEQKQAEAALRDSELRAKLALSSAEMGVWQCYVVDGRFVDLTGDERAIALLGGQPGLPASFEVFAARIHPEDRLRLTPAATRALAPDGDGQLDLDYRVLADGDAPERWVHARAQLVAEPTGLRLVGTVRDITATKDAEAQQRVVSAELHHRIKNTLAMVAAIATQTLRGDDIADRRNDFSARLAALAGAHDMLMTATWSSAPLRSVVESAVEPHRSMHRRIEVSGPQVDLSPRQALSMALAVHELATNAVKYGALSVDGGRVDISWSTDGVGADGAAQFVFAWRESGGPPVVLPSRKGFGSRLISKVLPGDFRGEVQVDYAPGGMVCTLTAPMAGLSPQ